VTYVANKTFYDFIIIYIERPVKPKAGSKSLFDRRGEVGEKRHKLFLKRSSPHPPFFTILPEGSSSRRSQ
jgi:hypothetical protein